MQTSLPVDVVAFGEAARARVNALGGVEVALRAEADSTARASAADALSELGAWDVDVRAGSDELLAGAVLCRAAGAVVLPHPLVEQLLAVDGYRLALVDPERTWIDHGDMDGSWLGADLDGNAWQLTTEPRRSHKLGPFVTRARRGDAAERVPLDDVARHLVLGSWRLLGGLDAALAVAAEHVKVRKQFGQALAEFQSVRFAVADAVVAHRGLDELATFTIWRLATASLAARVADAIALRLHADDVAVQVLRSCHQMFGAIGFCDEHDVSVLDRHMQSLLRLPYSAEALADRLVPAVSAGELESLFTSSRR
jgi:acyl-CoA dehydrogenase